MTVSHDGALHSEQERRPSNGAALVWLTVASIIPLLPAIVAFFRLGVPDYVTNGDAAAPELRVLHAERGLQLLGPYSRFGWSHPGPLFFYSALPFYKYFDHRAASLNVFMLCVATLCTILIVYSAFKLRGAGFAWTVLGMLALFERVSLPFVQTVEWNPVSPILPLVLACFWAARLFVGEHHLLPWFVLVASACVQTHIGFAPAIFGLLPFAVSGFVGSEGNTAKANRSLLLALAVLVLCWMPAALDIVGHRENNLVRIMEFFVAPRVSEHSWLTDTRTSMGQWSSAALAIVTAFGIQVPFERWRVALPMAVVLVGVVAIGVLAARRRRDESLKAICLVAAMELLITIPAVHAIRGPVLPYLVLWATVPGFLAVVSVCAVVEHFVPRSRRSYQTWASAAVAIICAAATWNHSILMTPDPETARVAAAVERRLRSEPAASVVVGIDGNEAWPLAAGVVTNLVKHRLPVFVEPAWLFLFGEQMAAPSGHHLALVFGHGVGGSRKRDSDDGGELVASSGSVRVRLSRER